MKLNSYGVWTNIAYYKDGIWTDTWCRGWQDETSPELIQHCRNNRVDINYIYIEHYHHGRPSDPTLI